MCYLIEEILDESLISFIYIYIHVLIYIGVDTWHIFKCFFKIHWPGFYLMTNMLWINYLKFFFDFMQFWRFAGRKTAYWSKFHPKILLTNLFFKHKHIIHISIFSEFYADSELHYNHITKNHSFHNIKVKLSFVNTKKYPNMI